MASVILTNRLYFKSGEEGVSAVVGYESNSNRIARYNLDPPEIGANRVDLRFTGNWKGAGTLPEKLFFFIGTDPSSHANAGKDSPRTGELTRKSGTYDYYGSADFVLLPKTTYYVWIFPSSTTFGWLYWSWDEEDAVVETSGGAFSIVNHQTLTLGEKSTIEITRFNVSYTHTIKYSIGSVTGVICEKSNLLSVPWTPNIDLAYQITDSESGTVDIVVESYSGESLVGTAPAVQFTLNVPEYIIPTVTATAKDLSDGYDAFESFVQGVSYVSFDTSPAGSYGSTIKKTEVFCDGSLYNGAVVEKSGKVLFSVICTDSRGRIGEHSIYLDFAEYKIPYVSLSASRCDSEGEPDESGEFANIKINVVTYQVNERNTARVILTFGNQTETIPTDTGNVTITRIVDAPSVSTLQLRAIAHDKIRTSVESEMVLSVGYATLDFLAGGKGIAFGTTAKQEGFECAMPAIFTAGVIGAWPFSELAEGCYGRTVDGVTEWLNPPMAVGVEYRTTERYLGKPVYAKAVSCDVAKLTANTAVAFSHGATNVDRVVGFTGSLHQGTSSGLGLPFEISATNYCRLYVNYQNIGFLVGDAALTRYAEAIVQIRYTKSTD